MPILICLSLSHVWHMTSDNAGAWAHMPWPSPYRELSFGNRRRSMHGWMGGAVVRYPLIPVSPALVHLYGSLYRTDKAKLFHKLMKLINNEPPPETDIFIIDAMLFLHTLQNLRNTYGKIAEEFLQRLCRLGPKVHFLMSTKCCLLKKWRERDGVGLASYT